MSQTASHILMVRPAGFQFNAETAVSNSFQNQITGKTPAEILEMARAEFDAFVQKLRDHGVEVSVVEDTALPVKPDAIFPNNWVSFHADGTVYLYPMCTPNRRLERRADIIETLKNEFEIRDVRDWSAYEQENRILEGTGSMVLDHLNKKAYACLSPRTEKALFEAYSAEIGYKPVVFTSVDAQGAEVYHTNVVMCAGAGFVVICLDSIANEAERESVAQEILTSGNEIVAISLGQMNQFAGNMLQVSATNGDTFLVMSHTAYKALNPEQIAILRKYTQILPVKIDTIETIGGGSARCMMAEIFCNKRIS